MWILCPMSPEANPSSPETRGVGIVPRVIPEPSSSNDPSARTGPGPPSGPVGRQDQSIRGTPARRDRGRGRPPNGPGRASTGPSAVGPARIHRCPSPGPAFGSGFRSESSSGSGPGHFGFPDGPGLAGSSRAQTRRGVASRFFDIIPRICLESLNQSPHALPIARTHDTGRGGMASKRAHPEIPRQGDGATGRTGGVQPGSCIRRGDAIRPAPFAYITS